MTFDFPHERWFSNHGFDGYGTIAVVRQGERECLALKPMAPTSAAETHAALITSAYTYGDCEATFLDVVTIEQLRQGSDPNAWERAWMLWHFIDVRHFYYFILKANGWELGKLDPTYDGGQRFLATGNNRCFPIGICNTVNVRLRENAMIVSVDGETIVSYIDTGDANTRGSRRAYVAGRFGFYCEDAHVRFGGFTVKT